MNKETIVGIAVVGAGVAVIAGGAVLIAKKVKKMKANTNKAAESSTVETNDIHNDPSEKAKDDDVVPPICEREYVPRCSGRYPWINNDYVTLAKEVGDEEEADDVHYISPFGQFDIRDNDEVDKIEGNFIYSFDTDEFYVDKNDAYVTYDLSVVRDYISNMVHSIKNTTGRLICIDSFDGTTVSVKVV